MIAKDLQQSFYWNTTVEAVDRTRITIVVISYLSTYAVFVELLTLDSFRELT